MRTLPHMWLERACSGRYQNLVRLGELGGVQSIKRTVELNLERATKWPLLSHVGVRRREAPQAPV